MVSWLRTLSPRVVIGITGVPVPDRMNLEIPVVAGIATTAEARDLLDQAGIRLLSDGIFSGIYAGLIKQCNIEKVPCIALLAESHLNFPDPSASLEALGAVNRLANLNIDLKPLEKEAERIKINVRDLMHRTEKVLNELEQIEHGTSQSMYR